LSDFCKELTHITQQEISEARRFNEVYKHFSDWYGSKNKNILASWGAFDRNGLIRDCDLHQLEFLQGTEHWNVKNMFRERYNQKKLGLGKAITYLGMEFDGTPHRALYDAVNTANILRRLFCHAD
jgi:inhibitor of KinA sporulation pathway (predicted exonuclease)